MTASTVGRLAPALALCLAACSGRIERDGPPFPFEPAAAWRLRLAFGSSLEGQECIDVDSAGAVRMVRGFDQPGWQRASGTLDAAAVGRVRELLVRRHIATLKRLYEDPGVYDGEQWLLCLEQAGRRRIVYCNNHFPPRLRTFQGELRALVEPRLDGWAPLDMDDVRAAVQPIWDLLAEQPVAR